VLPCSKHNLELCSVELKDAGRTFNSGIPPVRREQRRNQWNSTFYPNRCNRRTTHATARMNQLSGIALSSLMSPRLCGYGLIATHRAQHGMMSCTLRLRPRCQIHRLHLSSSVSNETISFAAVSLDTPRVPVNKRSNRCKSIFACVWHPSGKPGRLPQPRRSMLA
jgi:hypothetical protein